MLDSFSAALRAFREENQLNLRELARRTHISPTYLSNIENGSRPATEGVAIRCDEALDTSPLLHVLLSIERGHPMLRRVLFGGTLGLAGGALFAHVDTTAALAASVNAALRVNLDDPDWDVIAADFSRRYVLASDADFGPELAAQIMVAHQRFLDGDAAAGRCAATLTLLYGLWVGDAGRLMTAQSLYATATALADGTGDQRLRALVRARVASRGPYEGWSAARAETTARHALELVSTGAAAVEAHSALVHLAALTGRLEQGRAAVRAMYAAAEAADTTDEPSLFLRAASFDNYLECRAGSLADASAAYARTVEPLAAVPLWHTEAQIYYGRALVAAGDVERGAQLALDAVRTLPAAHRIIGLGVRDVLATVPAGVPSDAVAALRGYASPGPVPWEMLR